MSSFLFPEIQSQFIQQMAQNEIKVYVRVPDYINKFK